MKSCLYLNRKKLNRHRLCVYLLTVALLIPVLTLCTVNGYCNGLHCTADREVRPGGTFTVRLGVDASAIGYEGRFSFDSSRVTLTRVVPINSNLYTEFRVSTEEGSVYVEHREPVKQMLQFTFSVSSSVAVGETVSVRFHDGSVFGNGNSESVSDQVCTVVVNEKKSSDATLRSIRLSVYETAQDRDQNQNSFIASLSPAFSAKEYSYSATVPHEYAFFRIGADVNDSNAVVSVSDGILTAGAVNTVTVRVTAEDGTKSTYTVRVFREQKSDTSMDVSYPDLSSSDPDPSEAQPSETSSGGVETSSDIGAENSSSDESSEIVDDSSSEASSASSAPYIPSVSFPEDPEEQNWMGLFVAITAVGVGAIVALIVRVFVLFRRKQPK